MTPAVAARRQGDAPIDRTRLLANWVTERSFVDLREADVEQLEILVLDHLACVLRGSFLPWSRALIDWAKTYDGSGEAVLFGTELRTSALIAGFVNATAAHGLEYDDTHDASLSHPGAAVVATGLAVGTEVGATGKQVLQAIASGYEVTARVGRATGPSVLERGFHPTALFGGFGAATTAAILHGLDATGLCDTWGLLLSMAGGSMQFSQDPRGTVVKRLHGGYGAQHGILAAQLAARGLAGPAQALDGFYGLARLFGSDDRQTDWLVPEPGDRLAINQISLKPYPCCRLFHSTIDALRDILGVLPCDVQKVASISVGGPKVLPLQHMMRRPASAMAAQYSLPFCLGVAVMRGPYGEDSFDEASLGDPDVLAIADRVECVTDEVMERAFPEHFGTWVEVRFIDGTSVRRDRLDSLGTPAHPMSRGDVLHKFRRLARACPIEIDDHTVDVAVAALRHDEPVARLTRHFSQDRLRSRIPS
jgi:2-methylcitrate dehydratase PrpD